MGIILLIILYFIYLYITYYLLIFSSPFILLAIIGCILLAYINTGDKLITILLITPIILLEVYIFIKYLIKTFIPRHKFLKDIYKEILDKEYFKCADCNSTKPKLKFFTTNKMILCKGHCSQCNSTNLVITEAGKQFIGELSQKSLNNIKIKD